MNEKIARMDIGLFVATLLMLGFGLVFVYSSSFALSQHKYGGAEIFLARQAMRALLAIVSFAVFINIDYHLWGKLSKLGFITAVVLLVMVVLLPESHAINGAKRWLQFGPIQFQVSDFGRMALILVLARGCAETDANLREWKVLARQLVKIGIICGLIVIEPDFSIALTIAVVGISMLFIAGARFTHLLGLMLSALPVLLVLVLRTPYRLRRVMGFLDMSGRKNDIGYQTYQSLIGLGNGGIFGVGLGRGEQKYFYLPEPHTDFVFSILGEEIGFIGLLLIVAVFVFIIHRGMKIAVNAPDRMGQLMAYGFTFVIAVYAILHACVSTGLVPTTGVPMPFLSYGGVSLVFTMSAMGILLNISSQSRSTAEAPAVLRKRDRAKLSMVVEGVR